MGASASTIPEVLDKTAWNEYSEEIYNKLKDPQGLVSKVALHAELSNKKVTYLDKNLLPSPSTIYSFEDIHDVVSKEIREHAEVWVREKKDLNKVVQRFKTLENKVPAMNLIHGLTIAQLARIPRCDERMENGDYYSITLDYLVSSWKPRSIENNIGTKYKAFKIIYFSHRWSNSSAGLADDDSNSKAETIRSVTNYYRDEHQTDLYWWIDLTCANQDHLTGYIASLPLYIAASDEMISLYVPGEGGADYDKRAWIRCERALSACLCSPRAVKCIPPKHFHLEKASIPAEEWWTLVRSHSYATWSFLNLHFLTMTTRRILPLDKRRCSGISCSFTI